MPLQSLFTNALLNDIESSHLLQQTIAALQANKFVQVKIYKYNILKKKKKQQQYTFRKQLFSLFLFLKIPLPASTWEEK